MKVIQTCPTNEDKKETLELRVGDVFTCSKTTFMSMDAATITEKPVVLKLFNLTQNRVDSYSFTFDEVTLCPDAVLVLEPNE